MTSQCPAPDDEWEVLLHAADRAVRQWRTAHPRATFSEIEGAVDAELQRVRARMVADAARDGAVAAAGDALLHCPTCGERLQARGRRSRRVTVAGDQCVTLTRPYTVCPRCGTGLFPP
jgi:DNA-directed RNA polymerase subunit RPC12/RpoP